MHSFIPEFIYSPLTRKVSLTASCGLRPVQGAGETGRPFACPYGAMDTNPVAQTQAGLKRGKAGKEGNGMEQGTVGAGGRGALGNLASSWLAGRESPRACGSHLLLWGPPSKGPSPGTPVGAEGPCTLFP